MPSPRVTDAVLRVVKGAGFHLGETTTVNRDETTRHVINAVDARTGESFSAKVMFLLAFYTGSDKPHRV